MHGTAPGSVPVPVTTYGGLVSLARPESVPEGASPRTYDTDFDVGSVKTRDGLTSAYTYQGSSFTTNGSSAANVAVTNGTAWSNPGNALVAGQYATNAITNIALPIVSVEVVVEGLSTGFALITFSQNVPTFVINQQYTFSGLTSYTALNGKVLTALGQVPPNLRLGFAGIFPASNQQVFGLGIGQVAYGPASDTGQATVSGYISQTDLLNVTGFNFNLSSSGTVIGIQINFNAGATVNFDYLTLQMLKAGQPVGNIQQLNLPRAGIAPVIFGGPNNLLGASWLPSDINSTSFGVQITGNPITGTESPSTLSVGNGVSITIYFAPNSANFQFITTFTAQNGAVKNVSLDALGDLYVEDVTNNPGVISSVLTGITPNSYAVGVNGPDVEYLAFTNCFSGSDMPLQYSPQWIDRITQVGPGAAPVFTPSAAGNVNYPIVNITQPSAKSQGSSYFLQSAGPGSNTPGNVITFYYLDATVSPTPDQDLVNAFNSGFPVYVYASFSGTPTTFGPLVVQVTAVGEAQPPGQPRNFFYFCFQVTSTAYTYYQGSGNPGYTAHYQRTLATLTATNPVPGVTVGSQITVSGSSVSAWDSTWNVTETPNASDMVITGSSVTAGVATFNYAVVNASANPAAGELVTITNTLNANGQLNVSQWPIASVSGSSTGSFTVNGFPGTLNASFASENGLATTAGTIFDFDPGIALLGTSTNPIFGTGTGGDLVFNPTGLFIDPGTYQGTVFFITRNGYYTAPAPPVVFTVPNNTSVINVSQILLGPPNVVARGIAITEAGQNGVPGANFFTLPTPVVFYSQDVKYTATSFFVNDNVSTSATLFFTGAILDEAEAIDIYGYNLFNQIEISDPGWVTQYGQRNAYGLCWNKVQNFNNLSFDGGYLPNPGTGVNVPSGWTTPDVYGRLIVSPKFGNAYYIQNTSASTSTTAGLISQTAFQDAYQTPIININTPYSVRVTARCPSGSTAGDLVISLTANGFTYGSFTLSFAAMTSSFAIYTGTLLTTALPTVPSGLTLNVEASFLGAGADVEIDRIELYPTKIPILNTTVYFSYAGLPEQVDDTTGAVVFASENQQAVNGAFVLFDTFYALKGWAGKTPGGSMYSLQDSANLEPAQWQEPEVSQQSGAIGPMAFDVGKQWAVMANRKGIDLFEGGQPQKINHEVIQIWNAINWTAGQTIWLKNDETNRRLLIGIPLPTPNFWLPNAVTNANPTSPNVILVLNYQGLDSGYGIKSEPQMHTTMFGTLTAIDMRRKWSLWQIPSPYANIVQTSTDEEIYICNGIASSKVYHLDHTNTTDDGAVIDSLYTTAGLPELSKRAQLPQLGRNRVRWDYMQGALESGGTVNVRLLPNRLLFPEPSTYAAMTIAGGFTPGNPALDDIEASLNFGATRTFFEFRENDGFGFNLSNLVPQGRKDTWNVMRGQKT